VSSLLWPEALSLGGLFDSNATLNPFASANKIFLAYCSSDAWLGDVSAAQTLAAFDFAWAFRGRRILAATLRTLASELGLGAASAPHRLLLAGCSAGARGAMVNLDAVSASAPASVAVSGLLDSPLWINVQPIDAGIPSFEVQCADALSLFNASRALSPGCVAALPAAAGGPAAPYLCLMGQYLMPYIATPYFLNAAQFDVRSVTALRIELTLSFRVAGVPAVLRRGRYTVGEQQRADGVRQQLAGADAGGSDGAAHARAGGQRCLLPLLPQALPDAGARLLDGQGGQRNHGQRRLRLVLLRHAQHQRRLLPLLPALRHVLGYRTIWNIVSKRGGTSKGCVDIVGGGSRHAGASAKASSPVCQGVTLLLSRACSDV